MPQCPHCQNPYEPGQRYCSVCGSFLLHPEEGNTFCPQCGVRVSPRQEFCHECDAPLKGEGLIEEKVAPGEAPPAGPLSEPTPAAAAKGLSSWVMGILAVAGIIIILLLILLFSRTASPPTPPAVAPQAVAPAPAPATPTPRTPAPPVGPLTALTPSAPTTGANLKEQLQKVLTTLRDAQMKKNISEFMSVYATTFPNFDQKRQATLSSWENFDYANLVFTVDKVQAIDPKNALAWVTWYMDVRNRNTQELSSATQTYQVRFIEQQGGWRIMEIKDVS
jgi:hypothetical protein